ncbi:MAG TPA: cytochrome c peroxidase [Bacteroidia bacterium]|nr:cytochrome c peroxidase [Bacteroidia bacterium]
MKKTIFVSSIAAVVTACAIFASCKKQDHAVATNEDKPNLDYSYNYVLSPSININLTTSNAITNSGARLGRALFYDKKLSKNNMVACASCHKQEYAFADNVSFSDGFNGGKTSRNSLAIVNAIQSKGFFWDNRTLKLEDMVLQPIKHQVEMGLDNSNFLIEKLNATSYYPQLFNEAFGTPTITREAIGKALAQFIYSMFVSNSKADKANILFNGNGWNNNNGVLNADEQSGASLFQNFCANCHSSTNLRGWGDLAWGNIGLDSVYSDKGLGALTSNPTEDGVFKIPSLRNVGLTAPYMHDGRYATLEQVVEHYNSGIMYNANLSSQLLARDPVTYQPINQAVKFNLSDKNKQCLVAFLKTLTDYSLVSDPKFSNPYKN